MGYNNVVKTLHLLIVICKKTKLTENEKHIDNVYDFPGGKASSIVWPFSGGLSKIVAKLLTSCV